MTSRTLAAVVLGAATAVAGLSACTNASAGPDQPTGADKPITSAVDTHAASLLPVSTKQAKTITFASDASYAPFEYFDTDNTTMIGFDVQLGDALAAVLGVQAKHVNAGFDTILPGLAAGKYDVGASAFTVTAERRKVVDFIPYAAVGSGLAVATGNPDKLTLDDVSTLCGHTVTAQKGSIQGIQVLPELSGKCTAAGKKPIAIQLYPSQNQANLALSSGRADAVMADSAPLAYEAKQSGGQFELAKGADFDPAPLGLAIDNDNKLGPALAAAMQVLIKNGDLAKLAQRWNLPSGDVPSSSELVR
ncbi:MAG: ABC transporter substrate-binding protein [Marmoricola sp.]